MIQGDGISYSSIPAIYEALQKAGISAENLVLGMGGALLQRVNRDTQEYALKCSFAQVNGKEINVQKNPLELDANGNTRVSFKKSKSGKQKLVKENGVFKSYPASEAPQLPDELITVFENGEIKQQYTFDEIKKRAII